MNPLLAGFELLLPLAVKWAGEQERKILEEGVPLDEEGLGDARKMGVLQPEKIRVLKVRQVPMPGDFLLRRAAERTGLVSANTAGMALRYGIFVREDFWGNRALIAHECVHTAQYERMGGIREFLRQYLRECIEIGYPAAPMEQEAILKSAGL